MKLNGKKLSDTNVEILVFPRPENDIVLKIAAILDESDFERLCPEPVPGVIQKVGKAAEPDVDNPAYKKKIQDRWEKYTYWLMLKSLQANKELEWETIKYEDPSTWENIEKELTEAGFVRAERGRIMNAVLDVNSLSDRSIEKARKRFFDRAAEEARVSLSQKAGQ